MSMDELLLHLHTEFPGCVAALVVSAADGSAIGCRAREGADPQAMAAVVRDLFERSRALDATEPQEVVALAGDRIYIGRPLGPRAILAVVCDGASNLGLLLGSVRSAFAAAAARMPR